VIFQAGIICYEEMGNRIVEVVLTAWLVCRQYLYSCVHFFSFFFFWGGVGVCG